VESYLLDTSALTPLVDPGHPRHAAARSNVAALVNAPVYVSVLALAEMKYGIRLYEMAKGKVLPNASSMVSDAHKYPIQNVTFHTATEYAELKSLLAVHYLPNVSKQYRKPYVEDWIDQFTCKAIHIPDNDLWICAQAREMNFVVLCADKKMDKISLIDPKVRLKII
jgi:predicted nucleic acid-binding protein